jgi:hypothetical protein
VPGPGMVAQTLRWMLRPDSPVYIRPSLDPRFVGFLVGMWRRSNLRDQRAGFEANLGLATGTAEVLDAYRADGIEFEMHADGLLMAFTDRSSGTGCPSARARATSIDVPAVGLRGATNLSDAKVALTPFADRLRLAGTMEFAGLDEHVNDIRVRAILRAPAAYLRDWHPPAGPLRPRAGMRPMTPDGLPAVGRLPGIANAYVSAGHGMLGVTLAAGSARALAELVVRGVRPPQLVPFDPARF